MTARFISENYLKSLTAISGNVDVADLVPFVDLAQDVDVQEVLGSKLYGALMTAVAGSSVSSDQSALLQLIRPMHAYYTFWRAMPFLQTKFRNKGVLQGEAEAAKAVDSGDMKWLRNEVKNMGEFYKQRVQDYLCKNGSLFPEYVSPDNPLSPNANSGYECDLVLDPEERLDREFWRRYLA